MTQNIKLLDDSTINKIAAGEVVERPASIVKELLENSIDAESTSITIEIKEGGKSYIRVTDNGTGIEIRDIDLAFLRHSTSKITSAEDLSSTTTLGFRGEALASIASVSQVELITKTKDDISGVSAIVNGGVVRSKTDIGCPRGTTLIVKNIFYNTPVRQKFLKSDLTEASYISDIVYKLAIGNPHISFNYIKDNKTVIKTPGRGDLETTVYSVLGRDFIDSTFKINSECKDMSLKGFIGKLSYTRTNRSSQYLFINGRYIKDTAISKVIEDGYSTLLPTKRYPVFLLFIIIDPATVDINVHPTKTEVRFTDRDALSRFITRAVAEVLYSENLIPQVSFSNDDKTEKTRKLDSSIESQVILDSIVQKPNIDNNITVSTNDNFNKDNVNIDGSLLKIVDFNTEYSPKTNKWLTDLEEEVKQAKKLKEKTKAKTVGADSNDYTESLDRKSVLKKSHSQSNDMNIKENQDSIYEKQAFYKQHNNTSSRVPDIVVIGTLFKTYILGQDIENKKFYMIDQHAAHERVMYEKLREQFLAQNINTQMLLNTEVLELSLREIDLVKDNMKVFSDLGFEIEEFGDNTIALRGVPLVFGAPNSKRLFLDILDNLSENPSSNYELRLDRIMKLACTAAIKANDSIEDIEIEKLIEDLRNTKEPFTCPHGRPIIIEMSKREIERKFKRV